jgi:hypothetical protein
MVFAKNRMLFAQEFSAFALHATIKPQAAVGGFGPPEDLHRIRIPAEMAYS